MAGTPFQELLPRAAELGQAVAPKLLPGSGKTSQQGTVWGARQFRAKLNNGLDTSFGSLGLRYLHQSLEATADTVCA